jgi:phosphatidylserine/phosphatidylglycerophosphate/cardiolipin synthase-like enzyme
MNMTRVSLLIVLCLGLLGASPAVYFAPGDGPANAAIAEIGKASKTIHVHAYGFTDPAIADALIAAEKRGVKVTIIQDFRAEQGRGDQLQRCADVGCECYTDGKEPIAHEKAIIVDSSVVVCGSYNWTRAARRNNEQLQVEPYADLAASFEENFEKHKAHSAKLK